MNLECKRVLCTLTISSHRARQNILKGNDTISGEVTQTKLLCIPSEKGSTLKGKNLLLMGANSFLLE